MKRSQLSCHADLEAEPNNAVNNTVCQALPGWQARSRCQGLRVKQSSTDKLLTSSQSETAQLCGRIRLPLRLRERTRSDRSQCSGPLARVRCQIRSRGQPCARMRAVQSRGKKLRLPAFGKRWSKMLQPATGTVHVNHRELECSWLV